MKCPKCGATLFHIDKKGNEVRIKCYRTNKCGFVMTAVEFNEEE